MVVEQGVEGRGAVAVAVEAAAVPPLHAVPATSVRKGLNIKQTKGTHYLPASFLTAISLSMLAGSFSHSCIRMKGSLAELGMKQTVMMLMMGLQKLNCDIHD